MTNAFIKEIFQSVQGEALYIGEKQIFIRFCGCNLACDYCDTAFQKEDEVNIFGADVYLKNPVSASELSEIMKKFDAKTISLTGGEPLLQVDFLREFLPLTNKKIYLETNGTLPKELAQIIDFVDVVSMDIKLSSATKQPNQFEENEKFIKVSKNADKEIFAKIVLDNQYSKEELLSAIKLVNKYDVPLIIQPMDCKDKSRELEKNTLIELFNFVTQNCPNARLIPQMHKYLNLL